MKEMENEFNRIKREVATMFTPGPILSILLLVMQDTIANKGAAKVVLDVFYVIFGFL